MTIGFDVLGHSHVLRINWLKRTGAYLIDCVIVLLPTWAVLTTIGVTTEVVFGLASGVVFLFYGTFIETSTESTVGKRLFGLKVRSHKGVLTPAQALVRNIPKFFWFFFPAIDALLGLATEGDPRQRFSDKILGSTVVQAHYLKTKVRRAGHGKDVAQPPAKA